MLPPIHCLALALALVAPHPPRSTHSRVQRPIVALEQPLAARDELKSRFSRGDEETPKTTFRPGPSCWDMLGRTFMWLTEVPLVEPRSVTRTLRPRTSTFAWVPDTASRSMT